MMTDTFEVASFFDAPHMDAGTYEQMAEAVHETFAVREKFDTQVNQYRERVGAGQGDPLRLALGLLTLGRFGEALEAFSKAPASALRHVYAAQAAAGLRRYDVAVAELRQAAQQGHDAVDAELRAAEYLALAGDDAGAQKLVDKHAQSGPDRAQWHFVRGLLAERRDERVEASTAYERALTLAPDHAATLFCAARLFDQLGDDAAALDCYERLTDQPRAYVNALINAAVIYEDIGRYQDALHCIRRVLKAYPNHTRARLFQKDIESSCLEVIEEGVEEKVDQRKRLLDTPLTEFELSVRARNCLKKMNVHSLGDLIQLGEDELLAYKNFGETSLAEIRGLLEKKGLRLGQPPEEVDVAALEQAAPERRVPALPPGQEAVLAKPVSELELSVRARRCLQRLNVQTLADLVQYSEADLLATRNFGVTSLNEVKARLAESNLQLAPKKA